MPTWGWIVIAVVVIGIIKIAAFKAIQNRKKNQKDEDI